MKLDKLTQGWVTRTSPFINDIGREDKSFMEPVFYVGKLGEDYVILTKTMIIKLNKNQNSNVLDEHWSRL